MNILTLSENKSGVDITLDGIDLARDLTSTIITQIHLKLTFISKNIIIISGIKD